MGASSWSYFTPYQQDINTALKELKEEVFKKGQYKHPFEVDPNTAERNLDFLASIYQSLPNEIRRQTDQFLESSRVAMNKRQSAQIANSINELLEQCGEDGTHSILDMETISSSPGFRVIAPLPRASLLDFFGTDRPTHEMVAKWSDRNDPPTSRSLYERWEGIYIIIYKDTEPIEIYFEGASGD
jgi:hypothetical protein